VNPINAATLIEDLRSGTHDENRGLRHGRTADRWGGPHWPYRHVGECADADALTRVCTVNPGPDDHRCQCRKGPRQCCERMNTEDLSCEPCRQWCGELPAESVFPGGTS
jgi:hypothetical protein